MKVLIIARKKESFPGNLAPFVLEQGKALEAQGIEVFYFPFDSHYWDVRAVNKKIKEIRPDIIHAHYGLCGIPALLQNSIPVVVTFHNGETLNWYVNLLTSFFSLKAKHVIYVAEHIYKTCFFKRKTHYSIIPCGINLSDCLITEHNKAREDLGFQNSIKYILFGGAFDNLRKNYPLLKEAIELLNYKENIVCIEMKGLSRADVTKLLCACDVFALPTKSEGSPQALKEAMACNCPIVASDVADIKHLLGNIQGHYICSLNPEDVARQLEKALNFNNKTNGRERIIKLGLSNDIISNKLIAIYTSIL